MSSPLLHIRESQSCDNKLDIFLRRHRLADNTDRSAGNWRKNEKCVVRSQNVSEICSGCKKIVFLESFSMDSLHYRLIFDLVNKNEIPEKNLLKVVKFQNLVEKCCTVSKI